MTSTNNIFAIKGGIPSVGSSPNPNFYLLCYDFNSNIGYIEEKAKNMWRLYTRFQNILKQYQDVNNEEKKFYYNSDSLQKCVDKLQEITGRPVKVLTKDEVINLKEKS